MNIKKFLFGVSFMLMGYACLNKVNGQQDCFPILNPDIYFCTEETPFVCLKKNEKGCCIRYGCKEE